MKIARQFKSSVEKHKIETAIQRGYGFNISLKKRNELRMNESFESPTECWERTSIECEKVTSGKKAKKVHVGYGTILLWRENECINLVNSYPDGHFINFTKLAREYGIMMSKNQFPGNGGQLLKEFLIKKGVNVDRFDYRKKK